MIYQLVVPRTKIFLVHAEFTSQDKHPRKSRWRRLRQSSIRQARERDAGWFGWCAERTQGDLTMLLPRPPRKWTPRRGEPFNLFTYTLGLVVRLPATWSPGTSPINEVPTPVRDTSVGGKPPRNLSVFARPVRLACCPACCPASADEPLHRGARTISRTVWAFDGRASADGRGRASIGIQHASAWDRGQSFYSYVVHSARVRKGHAISDSLPMK